MGKVTAVLDVNVWRRDERTKTARVRQPVRALVTCFRPTRILNDSRKWESRRCTKVNESCGNVVNRRRPKRKSELRRDLWGWSKVKLPPVAQRGIARRTKSARLEAFGRGCFVLCLTDELARLFEVLFTLPVAQE